MALIQQGLPDNAIAHYQRMLGLQAEGVAFVRRMWRQVEPSRIVDSWREILVSEKTRFESIQFRAAYEGASYSGRTLAEQDVYQAPEFFVDPYGFVGMSSEGGSLESALLDPAYRSVDQIGRGLGTHEALNKGGKKLDLLAASILADTGRASASVDVSVRPRVGYVRMVNPPSCPDCVILAGKFFRHNEGFLRHPNCDCTHVPTTRSKADSDEGLVADPYEYFRGLSEEEQDRMFGREDAQAIRDGADIWRVRNSRRRLDSSASSSGGAIFTREGMSRRGFARQELKPGQRRLTPHGIYSQAEKFGMDRDGTLRTLEEHGYILPGGQNPHGSIRGQVFNARSSMTAAEKRYADAVRNWEEVQRGLNPYSSAAPVRRRIERGDNIRQWAVDTPLTDHERARAEAEYYAALVTRGEAFTGSGQSLASARALNRAYYNEFYGLS